MVHGAKSQLGATESKKFSPKQANEDWLSIWNDTPGETMQLAEDVHK